MITTDRNIGIMAHVTAKHKEMFRAEAARRHMSMSELVSIILAQWLEHAPEEQLEKKRSNKRSFDSLNEIGQHLIRISDNNERIVLPGIPGHRHSIGIDGKPTCGCKFEVEVPLPLDK